MSDAAPPSARASRDHFPLLAIAGIALLGVVGAALVRAADRGHFADALSTYRSDRRGARALYLLTEESGLQVDRVQKNLELIDPGSQLVLLGVDVKPTFKDLLSQDEDGDGVVDGEADDGDSEGDGRDGGVATPADAGTPEEALAAFFALVTDAGFARSADGGFALEKPPEREGLNTLFVTSLSKDEREKLLEHVNAGNLLLYAPLRAEVDPLLQALDVTVYPGTGAEPEVLAPAMPSLFTAGVGEVEAPVLAYMSLPLAAVPLLDNDRGLPVLALVPYGRGQVVLLTAPDLASNEWLAKRDNAQLWLSLFRAMAERGPVLFDEYHHGFTSERSVAELASRYGLHFAIGQLLVGLALWAGALRRFGRPRAPPAQERLAAADALSAISRIYREGKHGAHAAAQILRGLLQDLAPIAGRRPQDGPRLVGAGLEARGRKDLAAALAEVEQLAATASTERDVERIARAAALARRRLART